MLPMPQDTFIHPGATYMYGATEILRIVKHE